MQQHPAPPFDMNALASAAETDDQLARRLANKPAILSETQCRATTLFWEACKIPGIRAPLDALMADFGMRSAQAARTAPVASAGLPQPVAVFRVAIEAGDFFGDLVSLGLNMHNPLQVPSGSPNPGEFPNTPAARAVLQSRPALAAYLARQDALRAKRDAAFAEQLDLTRRQAPQTFLTFIRQHHGIDLQLRGQEIVAPPGTDMSKLLPSEIASIKDWKPELVAILKAEGAGRKAVKADEPLVLA